MNRRTFLLALGASACSAAPTPRPTRARRKQRPKPTGAQVNIDLALRASQVHASPIALRGDVLFQVAGDDLRKWNVPTMQRGAVWNLWPRHVCFVQDGTLVAFALPPEVRHSVVHRISADDGIETLAGPVFRSRGTSVVLPGRAPDDIYVTEVDDIVRLQLTDTVAEELPGMKHPSPNAGNRDQLVARGDGRIIGLDSRGGFSVLDPQHPPVAYRTPGRSPLHLVAGSRDLIWYSFAADAPSWNATTLVLARLTTPMDAVKQLDFAPRRIVHLASGGGAAAVLVTTLRGVGDLRWEIIVVDETGAERWRVDVPAAFNPYTALTAGFVAISERYVVLTGPDEALLAWDAATGKPLG